MAASPGFNQVAHAQALSAMADQAATVQNVPVTIPVLIAAVKASSGFLQDVPYDQISSWINLLVVFDVVFTAAAFMVFDYIVEE